MFVTIARDPARFRHLLPFGVRLKVAYCALASGYWSRQGIHDMWRIFAVVVLVMGLLCVGGPDCAAWDVRPTRAKGRRTSTRSPRWR
jgi:hypothetical protein